MELLSTDKDTFSALLRTLPRNVSRKKQKHGLRDRFRVAEEDHRDTEACNAQSVTMPKPETRQI
jgi:hypothetical protein